MSIASPEHLQPAVATSTGMHSAGNCPRLAALDTFRGLTIIAMVFVNYLAGIKDIPAWARHRPEQLEGYTFVDVVFPAFLFIVGVALPLSCSQRLRNTPSPWPLLAHIITRAVSLIFLGVIMVNSSFYSARETGLSKNLWFLLAMVCVVVIWNVYPSNVSRQRQHRYFGIRCGAGLLLGILLCLFRGTNAEGTVVWLQHSWWGILGLIGWAYLVCACIYLICRDRPIRLIAMLGLLLGLYVGDRHGALQWLSPVQEFIAIGPVLGSTAASVMVGVLVGTWFLNPTSSSMKRCGIVLLFGAGLYLVGTLVRPLHGINKVAATESYALVCGGLCCFSFAVVYFIMDVKQLRDWARPIIPVGQNALFAYILPGMVANFLGLFGLKSILWPFNSSWPGVLNALAVTTLMVFLTWTASKVGIRVRL